MDAKRNHEWIRSVCLLAQEVAKISVHGKKKIYFTCLFNKF